MQTTHLVVTSGDPATAANLAAKLSPHVHRVIIGSSLPEARAAIARNRATGVVLDLETLDMAAVQELSREFRETAVICTHRLADEHMWTAALSAGASDCCHDGDVPGILRAVRINLQNARSTAA